MGVVYAFICEQVKELIGEVLVTLGNEGKKLKGPFNERIAKRMAELGMQRLEEFADHFGLGRTTVYTLVLGRVSPRGTWVKPSIDTLVKLAGALEVPLHILVYELEPNAPGAGEASREQPQSPQPPLRRVEVRRAGWCGAGPEQEEEIVDDVVWVEENFAQGKDLLAFQVRGDSMAGGRHPIYHGDTVVVDRNDKGYNNAAVVARLLSNGYVCKLLKDDRFSNVVRLASANPEHLNGTPTAVAPEDVAEIVGRVVRIIHDEDAPESAAAPKAA